MTQGSTKRIENTIFRIAVSYHEDCQARDRIVLKI